MVVEVKVSRVVFDGNWEIMEIFGEKFNANCFLGNFGDLLLRKLDVIGRLYSKLITTESHWGFFSVVGAWEVHWST